MKIINEEYGEAYQLEAGTRLEVERPNLFFSAYEEMSLPVDLPYTPRNRRLTGYPDQLTNKNRARTDIPCIITDGSYHVRCRQAVLGAIKNGSITTSFYFSENMLSEQLQKTNIKDVFKNETMPYVSNLEEAIAYCRLLLKNKDPHFTLFPVALKETGTNYYGNQTYQIMNEYGHMTRDIREEIEYFIRDFSNKPENDFYNATERTETVDGNTIRIGRGYYITPFIRAKYLMQRLFNYFGYTLQECPFTQQDAYFNLVFINRCADSIVNGKIYISDLCPNRTCAEILDVYRKMFAVEFDYNHENKTVRMLFLSDILKSNPSTDLSNLVNGAISISAPETYRRLVLQFESSESSLSYSTNEIALSKLRQQYPTAIFSETESMFYRVAYRCNITEKGPDHYVVTREYIAQGHNKYDYGDNMKTEELIIPVHQPAPVVQYYGPSWSSDILVGEAVFLNSKIVLDSMTTDENEQSGDTQAEHRDEPVILAFNKQGVIYNGRNQSPRGTIFFSKSEQQDQTGSLSLSPYGKHGLFEKFYQVYDGILRNSLWEINVKMRVPDLLKTSLKSYMPVWLGGQKLILDTFRYSLGGDDEELETTLKTTQLYEPVSTARPLEDLLDKPTGYHWTSKYEYQVISRGDYESSPYRDKPIPMLYPDFAREKYNDGKHYYERITARAFKYECLLIKVWLECEKDAE